MKKQIARTLVPLLLACAAALASAHADKHDEAGTAAPVSVEEHAFGKQGDPKRVNRTIVVDMKDTMRFVPGELTVKQGETIRFVVKNSGKVLHEMVIGTMEELKAHHALMQKHPDMEHEAPYSVHVSPGKKGPIIWQFTQTGEFYYACLIPGHFEAGMVGKIKVVKG